MKDTHHEEKMGKMKKKLGKKKINSGTYQKNIPVKFTAHFREMS